MRTASRSRRTAVNDGGRFIQSKKPDGDTVSQAHIFFTGYAYFASQVRHESMNSYFSATGDPGRSTLRLFSGTRSPFEVPVVRAGLRATGYVRSVSRAVLRRRAHCGTDSPSSLVFRRSRRVPGRPGRSDESFRSPAERPRPETRD